MNETYCYEPAFINHPRIAREQIVDIHCQHETRRSLLLDHPDHCDAVISDPHAFTLHITERQSACVARTISPRERYLNQAAIDCVTLPDLSLQVQLYALGVMLSTARHLPDSEEGYEKIAALPSSLAHHARQGELQRLHAELPALNALKGSLINQLGAMSFDWDLLPESPRKGTLMIQIALLALQDENSEALMQQQLAHVWLAQGAQAFADHPWMLTHYLVYRLYHDLFPNQDAEQSYLQLCCDYFQLISLFGLWLLDGSALTRQDIVALVSMFEQWRLSENAARERNSDHALFDGDRMLAAFSLLTC